MIPQLSRTATHGVLACPSLGIPRGAPLHPEPLPCTPPPPSPRRVASFRATSSPGAGNQGCTQPPGGGRGRKVSVLEARQLARTEAAQPETPPRETRPPGDARRGPTRTLRSRRCPFKQLPAPIGRAGVGGAASVDVTLPAQPIYAGGVLGGGCGRVLGGECGLRGV